MSGSVALRLYSSASVRPMRTAALPFRSTAENLARWIFVALKDRIAGLHAVKVYETADSCAEYTAG